MWPRSGRAAAHAHLGLLAFSPLGEATAVGQAKSVRRLKESRVHAPKVELPGTPRGPSGRCLGIRLEGLRFDTRDRPSRLILTGVACPQWWRVNTARRGQVTDS